MKGKILSGVVLMVLLANTLNMFFNAIPAAGSTDILFEEDFESYPLDSFPSSRFYARWGGWWVAEEEGNRFLRSMSSETLNYDMITIQKFPGDTTIEYKIRHTRFLTPEKVDICVYEINGFEMVPGVFSVYMFVTHDCTATANYRWSPDGVHSEYGEQLEVESLISVESGIWYSVKIVFGEGYARLYVDDTLILEYDISELPFALEDFHIYWHTFGQRDLDNITVYSTPVTVPATIEIQPDTLNLGSRGKWITAYIELPEEHSVSDIDISTVALNGEVPAELHPTGIGDYDENSIPDLMVKFDRQDLIALMIVGEATLTISGELLDGTPFQGSKTIRAIGE